MYMIWLSGQLQQASLGPQAVPLAAAAAAAVGRRARCGHRHAGHATRLGCGSSLRPHRLLLLRALRSLLLLLLLLRVLLVFWPEP